MTRTRETRRRRPAAHAAALTAALPDDEVAYLAAGPAADGTTHRSAGLRRSAHISDPEDGEADHYTYTGRFNDD